MSGRACNKCHLEELRREAAAKGWILTVVPEPTDIAPDAVRVYMHPEGVDATEFGAASDYFRAWFMAVPEECAC